MEGLFQDTFFYTDVYELIFFLIHYFLNENRYDNDHVQMIHQYSQSTNF